MTVPRQYFFCGSFMDFFCLVFAMPLGASVYMCLVVTCWESLTSWLSFVVSNYEFVTFPLVSWVRGSAWLYRFLIFAPLLTLTVLITHYLNALPRTREEGIPRLVCATEGVDIQPMTALFHQQCNVCWCIWNDSRIALMFGPLFNSLITVQNVFSSVTYGRII